MFGIYSFCHLHLGNQRLSITNQSISQPVNVKECSLWFWHCNSHLAEGISKHNRFWQQCIRCLLDTRQAGIDTLMDETARHLPSCAHSGATGYNDRPVSQWWQCTPLLTSMWGYVKMFMGNNEINYFGANNVKVCKEKSSRISWKMHVMSKVCIDFRFFFLIKINLSLKKYWRGIDIHTDGRKQGEWERKRERWSVLIY